ncbi:UNVERIFIED_CONTAM: hypothetical protein Scaly_1500900 [Sesamum calycinum]|uniref:MULE transposase domain-containing protein n=1 Tax=Sesamum calycinum TaxID=2727403 RepID=A0AAW2PSM7_9LAMI
MACLGLKLVEDVAAKTPQPLRENGLRTYNVKNVNSGWLSKKYIDAFRVDPKKNVKGFRNEVIREIRCSVSTFQAYRAKRRSMKEIEGDHDEQYAILWDYAHELKMKNSGSTVIMELSDGTEENKKFDRIWVMFQAYAVVGSETKQSWEWFFMLLKEDLHILRNDIYTFISDKQKGLLPAFENIFPGVDNRFCIKRLHRNMKTTGWKGLAYKRALWAVARATTVHEFDKYITEIGEMDVKCKEWLIEKPILTMSQWIREYLMTKLQ